MIACSCRRSGSARSRFCCRTRSRCTALRCRAGLFPRTRGTSARGAGRPARRPVSRQGHGRSSVRVNEPLSAVIASFETAPYSALPVVDAHALVGVVGLDELQPAARVVNASLLVAADFMRTDVQPLHPDDPLDVGMRQFVENDLRVLPVVERAPTPKLLGLVRRTDLAKAYLQKIQGDGKSATS
ncbi:MAG: CBS domain-containing protein [Isosphaeraceae bacterium]